MCFSFHHVDNVVTPVIFVWRAWNGHFSFPFKKEQHRQKF